MKQQKEVMEQQNREIQQTAARKEELIKQNKERELELKQLDHKLSKARGDAKDAEERVSRLRLWARGNGV